MRHLADLPNSDLPKLPSEQVRKLRGILKDIAQRQEEADRE